MKPRPTLTIGLISLTMIPLELTWTRLLSAEFFYTFAFLVLSLAILGLGLGALAVRLFDRLAQANRIGWYMGFAAICAIFGPTLVFALAPDFSLIFASWTAIGKLALTILILMSAYFFGGMALSLLFRTNHEQMPRLYMADLVGAGLGVIAAIWAMNCFQTPQASILVAVPILIAACLVNQSWQRLVPAVVAVVAVLLAPALARQMEIPRKDPGTVIFTHWDAMSKVKVLERGPGMRGLNVDNVANSPVFQFDGDWSTTDPDSVEWGIDVGNLIRRFPNCTFLSLGAGGGGDVLQALVEGAKEVHAVEINGYVNHMMLVADTQGYTRPAPPPDAASTASANSDSITQAPLQSVAEFSGYLYRDPRVKVVTEDARAYVRRHPGKFDVIYSLSSNTWAALASGSFALAENYLFTTEAFKDYWLSMSDSGFMMLEHQMYVPRLVTELMEALTDLGVPSPTDHFAVYDLPQMRRKMILLSRQPLTDDIRQNAFGPLTPERFGQIHLMFPPVNDSVGRHIIPRIITEGWKNLADTAPIDISPVTDNRPFVAQLGLWRNFTAEKRASVHPYAEFAGFPLSRVILLAVLAIVVVIAVPINLLPYLRRGPRLRCVPWLYFFCIGIAFMAVEVVLIQQYALLIGSSLYSVAVVLMTLLIASGIGSRFAKSLDDRVTFLAIAAWLVLNAIGFRYVVQVAGGFELIPRLIVAAVLIAPLGFFMGAPFPKGAGLVGELIDWGFAVNGTASVLGSTLVLIVAFAYGFSVALILAAITYLAAFALLRIRTAW